MPLWLHSLLCLPRTSSSPLCKARGLLLGHGTLDRHVSADTLLRATLSSPASLPNRPCPISSWWPSGDPGTPVSAEENPTPRDWAHSAPSRRVRFFANIAHAPGITEPSLRRCPAKRHGEPHSQGQGQGALVAPGSLHQPMGHGLVQFPMQALSRVHVSLCAASVCPHVSIGFF